MAITASITDFGLGLSGSWKWTGGSEVPELGLVFGVPRNATSILVIDDAAGTASLETWGADLSGSDKWIGAERGSNGLYYCAPYSASDILVANPSEGVAIRVAMGLSLSGNWKWQGMAASLDRRHVLGVPWNVADFLHIDTETPSGVLCGGVDIGTAQRSAFGASWSPDTFGEWNASAVGDNGLIYFTPFYSEYIAILNITAGVCVLSKLGATIARGGSKWTGASKCADGRILCCPYAASDMLIIDPSIPSGVLVGGIDAGTAIRSDFGETLDGNWSSQDASYGGKAVFAPFNADTIAIVDSEAETVIQDDFGLDLSASNKIHDGFVRGPVTGKFYGMPFDWPYVLVLDLEEPPLTLSALPPTPIFLADAIDPYTLDYRSITRGVDPVEGAALEALIVERASGSATLEDGQRFADIRFVDDQLEQKLKDEVKYAWRRLLDANLIEFSALQVVATGDTASVKIGFKNLLSGRSREFNLPLLALRPSRGYQ